MIDVQDSKKESFLKLCDERFHPYINKVLDRLPQDAVEKVIDNTIVAVFDDSFYGGHWQLDSLIEHIIILNEKLLIQPKFVILHVIAHEMAHRVIGDGESGLREKEAEELVEKWGFGQGIEPNPFVEMEMNLLISYDRHRLHFLVEKYLDKPGNMSTIIKKLIVADELVKNGCDCLDKETLLPNMEVTDKWTQQCKEKYEETIRLLEEELKTNPGNYDAYALLGYCNMHMERYSKVVKNLIRAYRLCGYGEQYGEALLSAIKFYLQHRDYISKK